MAKGREGKEREEEESRGGMSDSAFNWTCAFLPDLPF